MLEKRFHDVQETEGFDWLVLRIFCELMLRYCAGFLSEAGLGPTKRMVVMISTSSG